MQLHLHGHKINGKREQSAELTSPVFQVFGKENSLVLQWRFFTDVWLSLTSCLATDTFLKR